MDTFELFNNGKLVLPEKEAGFAEIGWSKHPAFKGVELKHIITAKDTDGKFSCHLVRIAPGCSIGNHIHETQLETHEVIKGSGKCVNVEAAPFRMNPVQYLSCRRVCRMKSMRVQKGYICLPSLCLPYVELNKRIVCTNRRTMDFIRHMRRSAFFPDRPCGASAPFGGDFEVWRGSSR